MTGKAGRMAETPSGPYLRINILSEIGTKKKRGEGRLEAWMSSDIQAEHPKKESPTDGLGPMAGKGFYEKSVF